MEKPSLTERPPAPPSQFLPQEKTDRCAPGCTHKYDLLEYPSVRSKGYLFFCIFCLKIEERIFQGDDL